MPPRGYQKKITNCPHVGADHYARGMCQDCYTSWYISQPHVKERHKTNQQKYANSEKGKETARRYESKEMAKARFRRYYRAQVARFSAECAGGKKRKPRIVTC